MSKSNELKSARDVLLDLDNNTLKEMQVDNILVAIACEFILYRSENHLTQTQLAEKLGVSQSMMSKLESGEYNPSVRFLAELSQKMGWNFLIKCNATPAQVAAMETKLPPPMEQ